MSGEKEFEIKTYSFCELALLYFPDLMKKSASNNLSRWINNSERLLRELKSAEWKKRTKLTNSQASRNNHQSLRKTLELPSVIFTQRIDAYTKYSS